MFSERKERKNEIESKSLRFFVKVLLRSSFTKHFSLLVRTQESIASADYVSSRCESCLYSRFFSLSNVYHKNKPRESTAIKKEDEDEEWKSLNSGEKNLCACACGRRNSSWAQNLPLSIPGLVGYNANKWHTLTR